MQYKLILFADTLTSYKGDSTFFSKRAVEIVLGARQILSVGHFYEKKTDKCLLCILSSKGRF